MQSRLDKLIVVILDGCRYDTAVAQLGFMNHLVEHQQASLLKVKSELPSNSRPLYEVLMTGVPAYENGIYSNYHAQRSKEWSLFELVKEAGGKNRSRRLPLVQRVVQSSPPIIVWLIASSIRRSD